MTEQTIITQMTEEDPFILEFNKRYSNYIESEKKIYPHDKNRASDIYDAFRCLRWYVYKRLFWREQGLPEDNLIKIFKRGEDEEDSVTNFIQDKLKMKYYRWNPDVPLIDDLHLLSGTPDGTGELEIGGVIYKGGIDVKSVSGNLFSGIRTYDDIANSKHSWHRSYIYQCNTYMGLLKHLKWYLLFSNKQMKDFTLIKVPFTEEIFQQILVKCEEVNSWVKKYKLAFDDAFAKSTKDAVSLCDVKDRNDTIWWYENHLKGFVPPRIPYDPELCGDRCNFKHICKPLEVFRSEGVSLHLTDDESIALVQKYLDLKSSAKEYDDLDKWLTELGKVYDPEKQPNPKVLVGSSYVISFTARQRKDKWYYVKDITCLDKKIDESNMDVGAA